MYYDRQLVLEDTYSKKNIHSWIQSEIPTDSALFKKITRAIIRYLSQDTQIVQKRVRLMTMKRHSAETIATDVLHAVLSITDEVSSLQGIATALGSNYFDDTVLAARVGLDLLGACADTGLYDISIGNIDDGVSVVIPNYSLPQDVLDRIHVTMYLPPMLCAPRDWTTNSDGGMLTHSSSCILGSMNHHDDTQSLDVLNLLQAIPWKLNIDMLQEEEKTRVALTDSPDDVRKAKQHNDRCRQSNYVYDMMIAEGNHFYFMWKYDKRGRSYSQGYDVNLQGSEYKKAILEFANEEILEGV